MIEVVYYVAASLDGYIATPDGSVAWLEPFGGPEEYGYEELLASVDALLMGARTYEFCAALPEWPYPRHPSWVFAHGAPRPAAANVTVTTAPPAEVLAGLERADVRRAWLVGGGRLAASFRAAGLLTRYEVFVMPVVLGGGIPMLAPALGGDRLALEGSHAYPTGVVRLDYRTIPRH